MIHLAVKFEVDSLRPQHSLRVVRFELLNTLAKVQAESLNDVSFVFTVVFYAESVLWQENSFKQSESKTLCVLTFLSSCFFFLCSSFSSRRSTCCLASSIPGCSVLFPVILDQQPIYAVILLRQTTQNALPETIRGFWVFLHFIRVQCVKIFNQINHDNGLIWVTALVLTCLVLLLYLYYISGHCSISDSNMSSVCHLGKRKLTLREWYK